MVYSFNASETRAVWGGFSLKWYQALFMDSDILEALYVTVSVAALATLASTVMGTVAAIGIHSMKSWTRSLYMNITNLPMLMPDIVTGISLMILFIFVKLPRGYGTMLLAHITFDIPYVIFSVLPRLRRMNPNTYEAALDLGAKPFTALRKVLLPEIMPGVITGALLAFTMSLDDFVISYFTSVRTSNLSMLIYSMTRRKVPPTINALSTLMFVVVLSLLLFINLRGTSRKKKSLHSLRSGFQGREYPADTMIKEVPRS
ncbi:MAG TPA: ABC transporter permease [Candidatus Avichristensenella intestinipullorum]|uniref:ABC transporter permease n=1 Tax=Candidatus Avichristensenella intestinipullorum TaxID=2840693 RepID=A0A9D0YXF2_9FIRM|nr:ABC transporter permease [Candidatus Avichristensenella intestinipullorum]